MNKEDARHTEAKAYEGTNEIINRLMTEDDTIWIVTGVIGRQVILAGSAGEAEDKYNQQENKWRREDT